ncbi:zinc finger protein 704 isoform X3 [Crotalus tigris]|uniref:zinc finger protein 704 isoform X3 n=1 Tax=Crotalus tigris TaxID=88082 RepID=UPI00192F510F|nr:zinc finger protein 704 isoform X3 [Crotalus tigris]
MQARRLAKRSSLGNRRLNAAGPPSAAQPFPESGSRGIAKTENSWRPPRREGSAAALEEEDEEEDVVVDVEEDDDADETEELSGSVKGHAASRVSLKVTSIKHEMTFAAFQKEDLKSDLNQKLSDQQFFVLAMKEEDSKTETKKLGRIHDHEKENTRSICLLEQKRKVVSSNIDVPPTRKSSEEVDMDKVTAAMVLTTLSTSPLVRSPPIRPNESLNGSWKEGGFVPSSTSSSGYWSWSAPSDQSNPSTPSPPLSADSFKPFRLPSQTDDGIDEAETSSLLFDEPIPRKRKNSMKVMFKCLWKNCGKVLSTAVGIQKHIRTIHLGRVGESDYSDGEEDFYYTEIRLNTDSVADGLNSLSPVSPSLAFLPSFPSQDVNRSELSCAKTDAKGMTPLSRSAPTNLYLIHSDHAYQATAPVNIPGSAKFTPNGKSFSISWQTPPVTFTGLPVSPTHTRHVGIGEQKNQVHAVLSSPPRASVGLSEMNFEAEYINNLQKQICLLEYETTYLREKAKNATHIPPKVTRKAETLLQAMKELEATINRTEIDIAKKENSIMLYEAETQAIHKRLQILSDASAKEKLLLMEEVTKLKKMVEHSTQAISHKEAELLKIQREMQETVNLVKEKEYAVCLLESKCQQQIWQYQDMEKNLSELRSQ